MLLERDGVTRQPGFLQPNHLQRLLDGSLGRWSRVIDEKRLDIFCLDEVSEERKGFRGCI